MEFKNGISGKDKPGPLQYPSPQEKHISECPLESCSLSLYSPSTPASPLVPWEAEDQSRYFQTWSVLTSHSAAARGAKTQ